MKFPLPADTRAILEHGNVISKASNLGLLFNKYVYSWQNGWKMEEKDSKEFRQSVSSMTFANDHIANIAKRQQALIRSLQSSGWHVETFEAATDSRLIIGLGGTSVIETGMTLHPLYGFPYLPGSGLKGLARAYAEIAIEPKPSGDDLREIFGSEDKDPRHAKNNIRGRVFFMDGMPITFPKLDLDIMNPHYSEYYQGDKPPADYLSPVPVTFLAVAAGQAFCFCLYSRYKELAEKAKKWLFGGLAQLGAGGKTAVGYGYFREETVVSLHSARTLPKSTPPQRQETWQNAMLIWDTGRQAMIATIQQAKKSAGCTGDTARKLYQQLSDAERKQLESKGVTKNVMVEPVGNGFRLISIVS